MLAENAARHCSYHDLPWISSGFQDIFGSKLPITAKKTRFSKIYIGGTLWKKISKKNNFRRTLAHCAILKSAKFWYPDLSGATHLPSLWVCLRKTRCVCARWMSLCVVPTRPIATVLIWKMSDYGLTNLRMNEKKCTYPFYFCSLCKPWLLYHDMEQRASFVLGWTCNVKKDWVGYVRKQSRHL